jgi:hypothetical protein
MINASSGLITFSSNILTSNGSIGLLPYQCGSIHCVTYSGGTTIFASISAGSSATSIPGQASGLSGSSITSASVTLYWLAPSVGGAVSVYSVQYRITGTTPWLLAGTTNGSQSFTVVGLQAVTSYDFSVVANNGIGAGPISSVLTVATAATAILPGAPTTVTATNITSNSITCSWTAPVIAVVGMVYAVQCRIAGQSVWNSLAGNLSGTTVNLTNLLPSTAYNFQVTASTVNGSGPPSTIITAQTLQVVGLVSNITWSLAPTGTFAHGAGTIGVNAHVNPATAPIQFGFSTSSTTPPTSWTAAAYVNSDLWGQYVPTPATAGSWYGWAEGTDGSAPTVFATPFTVT